MLVPEQPETYKARRLRYEVVCNDTPLHIQGVRGINSAQELLLPEVLESAKVVQYVAASMLALITFDICVFFDDELKFVWKARLSWGKVLYLLIRYGSLLTITLALFGSLYVTPSSTIYIALACVLCLSVQVTQLLRAAAVYSDSSKKKIIICISSGLQIMVVFALSVRLTQSYQAIQYPFQGFSCALTATFPKPAYLSFYTVTVASDIAICATCAFKIFQLWAGGESKLAWIMFRDILVYMLLTTAIAVPQFLTPFFLPVKSSIIISGLSYAIITFSGLASCRMLLNMRSYVLGQPDISLITMVMAYPTTATISQIAFEGGGFEDNLPEGSRVSRQGEHETL